MNHYFKKNVIYNKRARSMAMLWTLLIFILCFLPGKDLPHVKVPFIDKWAHVVLFGVFSLLWHCATPTKSIWYKAILFSITVFAGWLVEYVQGHYVPDRSQDMMDVLADSIGGLAGILMYTAIYLTIDKHEIARDR